MVTTMRAAEVSWRDLSTRFGLQLTEDATFFLEWQAGLPEISDQEKQQLDRIRAGYFNLIYQTAMLEDAVKMAVLSPLLSLADFFLPPLYIQSEVAMQLSIADEELAIEGKIDILVLPDQLWIMLIEAKRAAASIEVGLPQLLAYMLASPNPAPPVYGMITNGGSFLFLKLVKSADTAPYALSRIFEMRSGFETSKSLRPSTRLSSVFAPTPTVRASPFSSCRALGSPCSRSISWLKTFPRSCQLRAAASVVSPLRTTPTVRTMCWQYLRMSKLPEPPLSSRRRTRSGVVSVATSPTSTATIGRSFGAQCLTTRPMALCASRHEAKNPLASLLRTADTRK